MATAARADTPPETDLASGDWTRKQIKQVLRELPLRAILAFAARTADRVQPLARSFSGTGVKLAEQFAAEPAAVDSGRAAAETGENWSCAAIAAVHAADDAAEAVQAAYKVAKYANLTSKRGRQKAREKTREVVRRAAHAATDAVEAAEAAAEAAGVSDVDAAVAVVRRAIAGDLLRLAERTPTANWLGPVIRPNDLGPLWPDGTEPVWWPGRAEAGIVPADDADSAARLAALTWLFERATPEALAHFPGAYVAVAGERILASGDDPRGVVTDALAVRPPVDPTRVAVALLRPAPAVW